jgi:predicted acetyltransferase
MKDTVQIIPATIKDYPVVQNLARFYVYDRSGFMQWGCEENGNFECIDFKPYFQQPDHYAFIIKIQGELAGFVLLDKEILSTPVDYNMGEFFIIAKFQGTNVAAIVANKIFENHKGKWSVAVMPENIKAVKFWNKIIAGITNGKFEQSYRPAKKADEYNTVIYHFDNSKASDRLTGYPI